MNRTRSCAKRTYAAAKSSIVAAFNPTAIQDARSARSRCPQPRFCPTSVEAAAAQPSPQNRANVSRRRPMPKAAWAAVRSRSGAARATNFST